MPAPKAGKKAASSRPAYSVPVNTALVLLVAVVAGSVLLFFSFDNLPGNLSRKPRHSKSKAPASSHVLASSQELLDGGRNWTIPCSKKEELMKSCGSSTCSRMVRDGVVEEHELSILTDLAERGMALGGAAGGPTILDLHSGALSKGTQFIDVFREAESRGADIFSAEAFDTYNAVKERIRTIASTAFGLQLHLTKPTFFSAITTKPAKTMHDEYWHPHIDKVTYGSFDVTCLLYLSTLGTNFSGGAFIFTDEADTTHAIVEPRRGRLSCFTSGAENIHFVDKVQSGRRLAVTVAFSCDARQAIPNPAPRQATTKAARPDSVY